MKTTHCRQCGVTFEYENRRRLFCDGCRDERKATRTAWFNTGERKLQRNLAHRYGIGVKDFNTLVRSANGKCQACGAIPDPEDPVWNRRLLGIDHEHASGRIRGMLCCSCNVALGYLQDDPDRILKLHDYLVRSMADA